MEQKLTSELIDTYTKLDPRSKTILRNFASVFSDSTIQFLSKTQIRQRNEERRAAAIQSQAGSQTSAVSVTTKPRRKKRDAQALTKQARLFQNVNNQ